MRYELIESDGQWTVVCDGLALSSHLEQSAALDAVAERLRNFSPDDRASLAVHFAKPAP